MPRKIAVVLSALALTVQAAAAQNAPVQGPAATPPRLLVMLAVDQLSADLFAEYRQHYTGGLKRLAGGVVFPSGYQSHSMTETCPGHSTILTGDRPTRTGIIANEWIDYSAAREDKTIYCAEDESVPGSTSRTYTVSPVHLKVPTLGDRMKAANPAMRSVSVAGKDRAAVMMGGHKPDSIWWWVNGKFVSYAGRNDTGVDAVNAGIARQLDAGHAPMDVPEFCRSKDWPVELGNGRSVGTGRFERAAGRTIQATPEKDAATLALASTLIDSMQLGRRGQTDIIAIGLSATDHVGHAFGTGGLEMCIQQAELDRMLGEFFASLDQRGIDYVVALTADHGGHDIPERLRLNGVPSETRVDAALMPRSLNQVLAQSTGITNALTATFEPFGDVWLGKDLTPAQRKTVFAAATALLRAHPQVAAAHTRDEIAATPLPVGPPDGWSLIQQARASFDPRRSGDIVIQLKQGITPITTLVGTIATHGSAWANDRRVPILFWRKGITPFEQPVAVETVDIMPSLAPFAGIRLAPGDVDGRCLDIYAGPADSCR